jgi:hypothetical protein
MEIFTQHSSEASVVAEVICEAATDGTDQLRYTAGDDAKMLMESLKKYSDAEFNGRIKSQLSL